MAQNKSTRIRSVSPVCLFLSEASAPGASLGSSVKNKHPDVDEDMEAEQQEVKRLKFSKEEEEDDEEEDEEEEQEVDTLTPLHAACLSKEAEAMVQEEEEEEEKAVYSKENEASSSGAAAAEDQGKFFKCSVSHCLVNWTVNVTASREAEFTQVVCEKCSNIKIIVVISTCFGPWGLFSGAA